MKAIKDVWFLGDSFLHEIFHTFWAMKIWNNPRASAESEPYLHQYYNVKAIHESSPFTRGNTLGKMLNGLITKMNDCEHLPHFLVMIPNGDLVHAMNHFEYGASTIISRCLEWLINQIDRAITACKSGL